MEKEEGLIKDKYELILGEVQTVVWMLYVLMIGVGMLFKYQEYAVFGINIFEYADVFDFLVAPFQDIRIIVASVLAFLFIFLFYKFDDYLLRINPERYARHNLGLNKKSWFETFRIIVLGLLLIGTIYTISIAFASVKKDAIDESPTTRITYSDNTAVRGKMIGKTKEVVFIFVDDKVKVIPITSLVKEISLD